MEVGRGFVEAVRSILVDDVERAGKPARGIGIDEPPPERLGDVYRALDELQAEATRVIRATEQEIARLEVDRGAREEPTLEPTGHRIQLSSTTAGVRVGGTVIERRSVLPMLIRDAEGRESGEGLRRVAHSQEPRRHAGATVVTVGALLGGREALHQMFLGVDCLVLGNRVVERFAEGRLARVVDVARRATRGMVIAWSRRAVGVRMAAHAVRLHGEGQHGELVALLRPPRRLIVPGNLRVDTGHGPEPSRIEVGIDEGFTARQNGRELREFVGVGAREVPGAARLRAGMAVGVVERVHDPRDGRMERLLRGVDDGAMTAAGSAGLVRDQEVAGITELAVGEKRGVPVIALRGIVATGGGGQL